MSKIIFRNDIHVGNLGERVSSTVAEYQSTVFDSGGVVIKYMEDGVEVRSVYVTMGELEAIYKNAKVAQTEMDPLV